MASVPAATSWHTRPAGPADVPGLCALFERAFGRPLPEAHWRWKLALRASAAVPVWLAEAEGRPICQYAGIARRCRTAAGELAAMVAVDGMTDPAFRRRGLLTEVVTAAHAAWRAAGIALVLGLPNEQWGSRTAALGWRPASELEWLALPLDPAALVARRLRQPLIARLPLRRLWRGVRRLRAAPDAGLRVRAVADLDPGFELAGQRVPALATDGAWLRWRYLSAPQPYELLLAERAGEALGYAALRLDVGPGRRSGLIAELRAAHDDERTAAALAMAASTHLEAQGAEAVFTLAAAGTPLRRALRRCGFWRARGSFGVHVVPLRAAAEPLVAARDWDLAGGDFDVV